MYTFCFVMCFLGGVLVGGEGGREEGGGGKGGVGGFFCTCGEGLREGLVEGNS